MWILVTFCMELSCSSTVAVRAVDVLFYLMSCDEWLSCSTPCASAIDCRPAAVVKTSHRGLNRRQQHTPGSLKCNSFFNPLGTKRWICIDFSLARSLLSGNTLSWLAARTATPLDLLVNRARLSFLNIIWFYYMACLF